MSNNKENITDSHLRELLQKHATDAPENPWFVKKVMNRLPDKQASRKKSAAEIFCYIMGGIGLICAWIYSAQSIATAGLTVSTIVTSGILTVLTLFCIGVFSFPIVRRGL